jgi:hypothetical protein
LDNINNVMFDILIVIAKKDFNKFPFLIDSILKDVDGFEEIYCVSDKEMPENIKIDGVNYFLDKDVIDFDFSKIEMEYRRGWYKQQFIKLFQDITQDNYLVIDGDIFINKPIKMSVDTPYFFIGMDQYHLPYFHFLKDVMNLDKAYPRSFICEMMLFKRDIIKHILEEMSVDKYQFFDICADGINKISNASGFSEYEMYGNYVTKNYPDLYGYKDIKVLHQHRKREWADDEVKKHIDKYIGSEYDIFTMHSWI